MHPHLRQQQQQHYEEHDPQYYDYHEQHETGEYPNNDHDATFASGGAAGNAPPPGRQLNLTQAESGVYDHPACTPDPVLATLISADVQGFLNGGKDDEDEM